MVGTKTERVHDGMRGACDDFVTRSKRSLVTALMLAVSFCGVVMPGCSTAASLGLPVSSCSNRLMGSADASRESLAKTPVLPRELAKDVQPPHRIEVGDVMAIEANDFNSTIRLPGDQTVLPDGTIELGTYGTLKVAGMTVKDVERNVQELIHQKVAADQQARGGSGILQAGDTGFGGPYDSVVPAVDYSASVRLVRQESTVFYVLGEVNAPGVYPLTGHETVLDAILAAGGVTTLGNEHKIILTRPTDNGEKMILPICYPSIVQLGNAKGNFQIQPGDRIYVPSLSLMEDIRQSLSVKRSNACPHCKPIR